MKNEAEMRSDSCATSLAALEVRKAWPRMSAEASTMKGGRRTPPLPRVKAPEAMPRLIAFADSRGLDPDRGVAVNAVLADGGIPDPVARLWAQAERIRAYLAHRRSDTEVAAATPQPLKISALRHRRRSPPDVCATVSRVGFQS